MDKPSTSIRIRLSVMMFLQYMMFAVWWVPLAAYLKNAGIDGTYKAWILSVMPLGCLLAPVFCMVADRHFASQKVLTVLNFGCALLFFLGARQTSPAAMFVILLLAMICYMPTWSLTNAIAMANYPSEKFPQIRVFGSIGWVACAVFSLVAATSLFGGKIIDGTTIPLYCGAATALVAALLNLTLPNTPPPAKGKEASIIDALGLRALTLLKDRNFAIFILISMFVMIPFTMYFSLGSQFFESQGFKQVTATMNLGQFVEIFLMLLVPLALLRFGVKWTMVAGRGRPNLPVLHRDPRARGHFRLLLRRRPGLRRQEGPAGDPRPGAGIDRPDLLRRRHAGRHLRQRRVDRTLHHRRHL